MKQILIQSIAEATQDPKVATGVITLGAGAATGTILDWWSAVAGIIASLVTVIVTIGLFYFNWEKNKREEELHRLKMQRHEKRRSTDPDFTPDE